MKFILCLFSLMASISFAAVPSKAPAPKPTNILAGDGALAGGVAGSAFSLTGVALNRVPHGERVVFDIGDGKGMPKKGLPGYYHVELQQNPPRLIIDMAQMPTVLVSDKAMRNSLKDSKMISRSSILVDPTDSTVSVILDLKKKAKAQVFQVDGKKGTSRVVVDLL